MTATPVFELKDAKMDIEEIITIAFALRFSFFKRYNRIRLQTHEIVGDEKPNMGSIVPLK